MVVVIPPDVIVKLNVVAPIGVPIELNVNAFDIGVKDGVLVNPLILLTVTFADAYCWLKVKLNVEDGGRGVGVGVMVGVGVGLGETYEPTLTLELIFVLPLIVIAILYYLNPTK